MRNRSLEHRAVGDNRKYSATDEFDGLLKQNQLVPCGCEATGTLELEWAYRNLRAHKPSFVPNLPGIQCNFQQRLRLPSTLRIRCLSITTATSAFTKALQRWLLEIRIYTTIRRPQVRRSCPIPADSRRFSTSAGFEGLQKQVAANALHNSGEVSHQLPKCHPGTRVAILNHLIAWALALTHTYPIIWLHGPAGAGKSAIQRTIAQFLYER